MTSQRENSRYTLPSSKRSSSSSEDEDDEETRRFRLQCAAVATTVSSAPPSTKRPKVSTKLLPSSSSTIARALEDRVDGILVFDDTKHPASTIINKSNTSSGMQLFRHGPSVSEYALARTTGNRIIQDTNNNNGRRERATTRRKNVLPSHRMIDHQALFASKEKGRIDQGVLVQGDSLLQTLVEKNQHKSGRMKLPHKGIVVETIRSKARLRLLQKNTS